MSATPLLDVQSDPTLTYNFEGLYTINIANFMHADSVPYRCLDSDEENAQPLAIVAHLNCSQTRCALDGLTISGAGYQRLMLLVVVFVAGVSRSITATVSPLSC